MSSKQTWSLADGYCQFEAKFWTLMIEETLSATHFCFVTKIHRKSVLCSNKMLLNRPWTFDQIFVRTFDERSLEQITKFAEFRLHYFCTILYAIETMFYTSSHVMWWSKRLQYTGKYLMCRLWMDFPECWFAFEVYLKRTPHTWDFTDKCHWAKWCSMIWITYREKTVNVHLTCLLYVIQLHD